MTRILYPILGLLVLIATVAQVRANRTPVHAEPDAPAVARFAQIVAEGRVVTYPGAEVTVGSDIAGTVERINVQEKQTVREGQILATIKADDTRAALTVARARVGEAAADVRLFESEVHRAKDLWQQDVGSKQTWDRAERDLDSARARLQSLAAEVSRLEAVVEKSVIPAPIGGVVIARHLHTGESLDAGEPIVTIADLSRTRVEAEVDEFDIAQVRLGAIVEVRAEGFQGSWKGTIEEIPDSVVNRRLKPPDPSKPIDTRVLLVKVAFDTPAPLKLGQRVEVKISAH